MNVTRNDFNRLMSPEACLKWLAEFEPEYCLDLSYMRRMALLPESGLRAVVLPAAGTMRRKSVRLRPADVVNFVKNLTIN